MDRGVMFQYFEWYRKPDCSLWRELAGRAAELARVGTTAVWVPPPYKSKEGKLGVGYSVYDMFDLGEFDQKGSVATKYGTKDEFLAAVKALHEAGVDVYVDAVFNHRMGGDDVEEVEIEEISCDNRNHIVSEPYKIKARSIYSFPGRAKKYSSFEFHWEHFNAFGHTVDAPDEHKIFRVKGKQFSDEVSCEHGNYDYLLGADVDTYHPQVREDLFLWGRWITELAGINGYRLDAVKHIPASFMRDFLKHQRESFPDREIFAVGEYWCQSRDELKKYLHDVEGCMHLFDVPLHYRFCEASRQGKDFDLRTIFDGSLLQTDPLMAVTFVENHDTQPGQSLESTVGDWFKPHAYALTLLRQDGYPTVFYGDYFGNEESDHPLTCHGSVICEMLQARAKYTFGDQYDYFDHPNCIGWTFSGGAEHPASMAVIMSNSEAGTKKMKTFQGEQTYRDITGNWPEPLTTDENGEAEFKCPPGKVSVWCPK